MVKLQQPQLKKIAYIPHDGSPGVEFPDVYWDPNTGAIYFGHDGDILVFVNGLLTLFLNFSLHLTVLSFGHFCYL